MSEVPVRDGRGGNWWWAHNAVLDDFGPQLGPFGIAVYVCLCRHAGKDGETWAGQKTISDQTSCSVRQVRRELDKLAALGLLRIEERRDSRGRLTNRYILLQPEEPDEPQRTTSPVPPASVAGTPGLPGRGCPASVAGPMMINKTQLTRLKEQEAAAADAAADARDDRANSHAPEDAAAARNPDPVKASTDEGAANESGETGLEQELLAALGAAPSPANVRAIAAVVRAFPALNHAQHAAVCAAHYDGLGRSPPSVAQYAAWCKQERPAARASPGRGRVAGSLTSVDLAQWAITGEEPEVGGPGDRRALGALGGGVARPERDAGYGAGLSPGLGRPAARAR